jgi:hypothetical protein
VTSIGKEAFRDCWSLKVVHIPNSVSEIKEGAFTQCTQLTSVILPDGLTRLEDWVFSLCYGLESIHIPEGVTYIGDYVFQGCKKITSIAIPDGVTVIGRDAFMNCSGLTTITLPAGLTSLGNGAFYGCKSLEYVYSYVEEPFELAADVFYHTGPSTMVMVPVGTLDAYYDAHWDTEQLAGGILENEWPRCATPTVTFTDGKLRVSCATEGAQCQTRIVHCDPDIYYENNNVDIPFTGRFTVFAYAYCDGYDNSQTVSVTFGWRPQPPTSNTTGDLNGDNQVNITDVITLVNKILGN